MLVCCCVVGVVVLVCYCVTVLVCWCVVVLVRWCVGVLVCYCVIVLLCCCVLVLLVLLCFVSVLARFKDAGWESIASDPLSFSMITARLFLFSM